VEFGALLKEFRLRGGWTQEELAERSGVSRHAVSVLEAGRRRPRLSSVAHLSAALGLDETDRDRLIAAAHQRVGGDADQTSIAEPAGVLRQLPADLSTFTGRESELAELMAAVDTSHAAGPRTVVISAIEGMPGVGKTHLAVHLAHRLVRADRFADGQLFVNLRGFDPDLPPLDPAAVLDSFLRALQVPAQQIPPVLDERSAMFRDLVHDRQVLVLLDNAVDEDQVRDLIPAGASCLVLITSRRSLAGLDGARPHNLDVFSTAEALELLGRIAGPERVAAEPQAAAELVELCGRLPLAVALTASHLRGRPHRSLEEQIARLHTHGIDAFGAGGRSLRPVFDISYRGLESQAQCLFRLLSLHPGADFTPQSAAALAGMKEAVTESLLERLIDEHLIEHRASGRLGYHDLLKQYAIDRAEDDEEEPDRAEALVRVLTWYLNTADAAARLHRPQRRHALLKPSVPGPLCLAFDSPSSARGWLAAEYANLLAAQRTAAEHDHHELAARIPQTLFEVFTGQGLWTDWTAACTLAVEAAKRLAEPRLEASLNLDLAGAVARTGSLDEAIKHYETTAALFVSAEDPIGEAAVYINLGQVHFSAQHFAQAQAHYQHALGLQRRIGNPGGEAAALDGLAKTSFETGNQDAARELLLQARELYRRTEDRFGEATATSNLGHLLARADRHHEAVAELRTAVELCQRVEHRMAEASCWESLADPLQALGDHQGAIDALTQAYSLFAGADETAARRVRVLLDRAADCRSTSNSAGPTGSEPQNHGG
jgi:transcriptional regulator with XRE-family HTH domain/tetratricopeptide (TPR) repeat protein